MKPLPKATKGKVVAFPRRDGVEALSDRALLAACAARDTSGLAALYDRYADDVVRYLGRLTFVDGNEVEDLLQDVFLQVYRSAATYRADSGVRTWILGIATNLARTSARSGDRRRAYQARAAAEQPERVEGTHDRRAIQRELVARLPAHLAALTAGQREAFVLCDVEQVPGVEAARALGIPVGTLYRRLHEARRCLRARMEGDES